MLHTMRRSQLFGGVRTVFERADHRFSLSSTADMFAHTDNLALCDLLTLQDLGLRTRLQFF
jgi:hypothetical protein